jgi:hypothetical protein
VSKRSVELRVRISSSRQKRSIVPYSAKALLEFFAHNVILKMNNDDRPRTEAIGDVRSILRDKQCLSDGRLVSF